MNLSKIEKLFNGRKGSPLGIASNYSVLLPLIYVRNKLHILYEIRSQALNTQPGEISFPGGMVEKGEGFKQACIRETQEELNITRKNIQLIGQLDYITSPFNFVLYAYCGILKGINREGIKPNKDEVDSIFTVPIDFFIENEPVCHDIYLETVTTDNFPYHLIQNGEKYNWRSGRYPVFFYEYEDYVIWGLTARITKNFIDIIKGV